MCAVGQTVGLFISIAGAAFARPAFADDKSPTLYTYVMRAKPIVLRDGGFGPIASLQMRVKELLLPIDAAASKALIADGQFGPKSGQALLRLLATPGYSEFAPKEGQPIRISEALWQKLLPGELLPVRWTLG